MDWHWLTDNTLGGLPSNTGALDYTQAKSKVEKLSIMKSNYLFIIDLHLQCPWPNDWWFVWTVLCWISVMSQKFILFLYSAWQTKHQLNIWFYIIHAYPDSMFIRFYDITNKCLICKISVLFPQPKIIVMVWVKITSWCSSLYRPDLACLCNPDPPISSSVYPPNRRVST